MMMIIIIYVFTHSHVLCTVDRNCPAYISSIIFGLQQFYMICSGLVLSIFFDPLIWAL